MKKILLIFLFSSFAAFSQNEELFEAANEAYSEAQYEEAIEKYQQILANEAISAELYYNLANSYFKSNQLAESIFYYEKALQLAPNNEDIQNNLIFAQKETVDAISEVENVGFEGFFKEISAIFNANTWSWIAIVLSFSFLALFILYYFSFSSFKKRIFFMSAILILLLAVFSTTMAYLRYDLFQNQNYAIVFADEVEVKNEPNARANEIFELHEGSKVKITENFQQWLQIELPDGKEGWIEAEAVKQL